ncbi:Large-conductance mechanosensitive channel [Pleomorphomonas sp. T1.2MG-36]|uniref:large conductance mechanosensitive channel protein MscL n=1 Tax=Pleomorphomonas sp. T1.2MG-36 TaxID=3041167 RepID=UPI002477AD87|nr:large conductance mechanosensitive channel protein MscL [Pleomorphomonas sp. T1.2MG-36]CAI9411638.1 Large-conductance mechanosensitive channel [Pleomorphomonas sp. T1.2MG-36]
MLKEFKEFALRGNMVDLAIGVIIGGAFGGLVNSIVADLLMPVIGLITGGIDFTNLYVQLSGAPVASDLEAARKAGATIAYGNFVTLVINFLIIAFVLFLVVKVMNRMKKASEPAVEAPPEVPADVALLTEIRDLLKKG